MNAVVKDRPAVPNLKDPKLFRDRAYVDGAWVEADGASCVNCSLRAFCFLSVVRRWACSSRSGISP